MRLVPSNPCRIWLEELIGSSRQLFLPPGRVTWLGLLIFFCGFASATEMDFLSDRTAIVVRGLEDTFLAHVQKSIDSGEDPHLDFSVRVGDCGDSKERTVPAIAGEIEIREGLLVFRPRYPFVAGMTYCARFANVDRAKELESWPASSNANREPSSQPKLQKVRWLKHTFPKPKLVSKTELLTIYPDLDRIPANMLRWYLVFSGPMTEGHAYDHIRLERANGDLVRDFVLQDQAELWNPERTRFTLFFDPSRVKRGLRYGEDVGPILIPGQRYTLIIDQAWQDHEGAPLLAIKRKSFEVVAADFEMPDPQRWSWHLPPAGSRSPLRINFGETLDYGLLLSSIRLRKDGKPIPGRPILGPNQHSWQWLPTSPWSPGLYEWSTIRWLSDPSGNNLAAPFEIQLGEHDSETLRRLESKPLVFQVELGTKPRKIMGVPKKSPKKSRSNQE